jgi:CDGSH-type Zn-finger protein
LPWNASTSKKASVSPDTAEHTSIDSFSKTARICNCGIKKPYCATTDIAATPLPETCEEMAAKITSNRQLHGFV